MFYRNLLLALGTVLVAAGLALSITWYGRCAAPAPGAGLPDASHPALLTAKHAIPAGAQLRAADIAWKDIAPGETRPGHLLRGQAPESEYLGTITRRAFAQGEALLAGELIAPGDRRFLAAVLKPGKRAVSIAVDAPQALSGLVLPGDYVDVILTQSFDDKFATAARRIAGETVLRDVRVIAVDQSLGEPAQTNAKAAAGAAQKQETRIPKTVTLEVDEHQAQTLFVAKEIGRLQLAARPLANSGVTQIGEGQRGAPTWASDVSPALRELVRSDVSPACGKPAGKTVPPMGTGSALESNVRYPPCPASSSWSQGEAQ
jgi:pilus assembly protein CpaB